MPAPIFCSKILPVFQRRKNIQTTERVEAFHSSVSYVRGKWNSEKDCGDILTNKIIARYGYISMTGYY